MNELEYIGNHIDTARMFNALSLIDKKREPLYMVDNDLAMDIYDLLEEYGEDNGLAEGWWQEYYDDEEEVLNAVIIWISQFIFLYYIR